MQKEIEATVKLWSSRLRQPEGDMGEWLGNALIALVQKYTQPPTDEQISIFEKSLANSLLEMVGECWPINNPEWGCWGRALQTDYGMDMYLRKAIDAAGINEMLIPIKSYTLTNPGYIIHAFGYSAKPQKLII